VGLVRTAGGAVSLRMPHGPMKGRATRAHGRPQVRGWPRAGRDAAGAGRGEHARALLYRIAPFNEIDEGAEADGVPLADDTH